MEKIISVEFSSEKAIFLDKLRLKIHHTPLFNILIVNNVTTAMNGLQLISKKWFRSNVCTHDSLLGIKIMINEKLDETFDEKPHIFDFENKNSILIGFQSTRGRHESKTFWKIPGWKKFLSLYIDNDINEHVTSHCHQFLIEEIKSGKSGILYGRANIKEIRLEKIGDKSGRNLLLIAVCNNNYNAVHNLLEVEYEIDETPSHPIDIAWTNFENFREEDKENAGKIMLCLLKANSRLPIGFIFEDAPMQIQELILFCESLHFSVENDDFESFKRNLPTYPNLIHFYDRNNQSLLAHAMKLRKNQILEFLDKGITIGCHEDLDEVYENLDRPELRQFREKHSVNANEDPKNHINVLKSRTAIGNNDLYARKRWKYMDEAFEALNANEYCRKILKVAAEFKKLKINFDFKHDSTYYLDPATSVYSKGIIYERGSIFIGAKYLTDDEKKFEVFGVLAHELCHLAVYLAFMNRNFDPFPLGESDNKTRFIDQVMVECKERADCGHIVANVFKSYPENIQDSEMIVTVPQMLMHYAQNEEKIEDVKVVFNELFNYVRDVIMPEMDRALPKIKVLGDENKQIVFEDLTIPMKAKILNSKVKFQQVHTSFYELIGDDNDILKLLNSNYIRLILLKNVTLEFNEMCDLKLEYGFIEKKFLCNTPERNNSVNLTYEDITSQEDASKIFLLADFAGTGKTTSLKYFTKKLKNEYTDKWVSFINLRKHAKVLDEFNDNTDDIGIIQVKDILIKMVNANPNIETSIFSKLFDQGRVILLFDGVDEVCPKFTNLLMKVFQIIKDNKEDNKMWVSTRMHYKTKLEKLFEVPSFKFAPYTKEERENHIEKIFKVKKINAEENKSSIMKKIYSVFEQTSKNLSNGIESINNPLMIEIITELCIENAINVDTANLYQLFKSAIKRQMEKNLKKIPEYERDPKSGFTKWKIHQILALKFIIGDDYDDYLFNLSELAIMKKWENEKQNRVWTWDMVQRYGFVIVTSENFEDDRDSIDFIHRTYAEFYVADFFLNFLFDNGKESQDECGKTMHLLDKIAKNKAKFDVVRSFMHTYITNITPKPKLNAKVEMMINGTLKVIEKRKNSNEVLSEELENFFEFYENLIDDEEITKNIIRVKGLILN